MNYKETYAKYLNSDHWKELRIKVFKVYGRSCFYHEKRVKHIHVHHMKYREYLSDCTERDCIPLCQECHTKAHSSPEELIQVKKDAGKFWACKNSKKRNKLKVKKKPKPEKCKESIKAVNARRNKFKATNKTRGPEKKEKWVDYKNKPITL